MDWVSRGSFSLLSASGVEPSIPRSEACTVMTSEWLSLFAFVLESPQAQKKLLNATNTRNGKGLFMLFSPRESRHLRPKDLGLTRST